MDTLESLAQIISKGVANIQVECKSHNQPFPSLDEPFTPDSDAIRQHVAEHVISVIAAAHQLIATLHHPATYNLMHAFSVHSSAALGVIIAANVPEILRESGPEGLHVSGIAAKNGIDPAKLSRLLRLLANQHIFTEVKPDIFRNNRISSTLDTGNSVDFLVKNPEGKYDHAVGIAPLAALVADEAMKSSAYLTETLLDPSSGHSDEPTHAAINRAFNTDLNMFPWYELPENAFRLRRFNIAMKSTLGMSAKTILSGFDWEALPKDSVVVDVGGGVGGTTMVLSDVHKHLHFIVQDRPAMVADGIKVWDAERPGSVASGLVQFQAHDFFEPQPIQNASVFILRAIMHDWPDRHAAEILRHLRAAAAPSTKLIVIDSVVRYPCSTQGEFKDIEGAEQPDAPAPLLANYGVASGLESQLDLQMMVVLNALERTIRQFKDLFQSAGWKLEKVSRSEGDSLYRLVASPA